MNFIKRALAVLMAVAMAASVTACSKDTSWAAEYNGERIPAGAYILYLQNAYYSAMPKVDDPSQNILDQTVEEGVTAREWIKGEAELSMKKLFAIRDSFKAQGLEITEEESAFIDRDIDAQWESYGDYYTDMGVQKASIRMLFEANIMAEKLFNSYYGEGGESAVSDEDIKNFTLDNYAMVSYIVVQTKPLDEDLDESGEPDASGQSEKDQHKGVYGKEAAQGYFDRIKGGEDFYTVALEHANTSMPEGEKVEKYEEGAEPNLLVKKDSYDYAPAAMVNKAFELKPGEVGMAEDETFFYILRRLDLSKDKDFFTENRQNLLYEFKTKEFHGRIEESAKNLDVKFNDSTMKLFTPEKLDLK